MANRAYFSAWARDFGEQTMLDLFQRLLETVPFAAEHPGFTRLAIHPVEPGETLLIEQDLRSRPVDAAGIVSLAKEYVHSDSAYEVQAFWDLWAYDTVESKWRLHPERLELICHGEDYDEGVYQSAGHFQVEIGFEHLFTGHAGLLGITAPQNPAPQHPAETAFLATMTRPENLRGYHERTQENIQRLMRWVQAAEAAVPFERYRLWSEGEENFEARLDEILAVG